MYKNNKFYTLAMDKICLSLQKNNHEEILYYIIVFYNRKR